ncbi:MAG: RnfABCDGE type electron transport complex subunit D [Spirochaetaceae bacterium]|jgi:electron transport complex protein RnfD|nr:RnfABCDGE type electron transport complex subunit D [Spirochaetaceae bacterium]
MAENENQAAKLLYIQSSPHIVRADDTASIMSRVIISLLPVTVWGIVIFGVSALLNVAVSVAAAVIGEALFRRITRQDIRIKDCSAAVTGLLLALVVPPSTPLWMTALGALFAVIVAKEFFGGLGANVFNPALAGRAFLLMSFPAAMTTWLKPSGLSTSFYQFSGGNLVDGATTATPLGIIKEGGFSGFGAVESSLGASSYGEMLKDLFLGNRAGCIGETSILLILAGGIFLLATKTIDWRAPVGLIAAAFIASWALGLDPVFSVLSGGVVFGAVFMATDYTSAPVTEKGKLIFGAGAGLLIVLIRTFGNYPEGVTYGILIMNMATPFLNRILHRKYGYIKPEKAAKVGKGVEK